MSGNGERLTSCAEQVPWYLMPVSFTRKAAAGRPPVARHTQSHTGRDLWRRHV